MKKVLAILLTLAMALSLSVTAFADDALNNNPSGLEEIENDNPREKGEEEESTTEETSAPVIAAENGVLTDENNYYEQDLTVGYNYTAAENSAEKVFCVTVEFSLPDDMALTYTGKQNVYTWDHTLGKYVLDADNSTDEEGTLTDEGAFTIKVTNKSNVPVEFDVAYAADTDAVFASEVTDWANNADVTLATVAAGQTIGDTDITITDVTTAITANTRFASADCTGKLSVTGINEGKEPTAEGTDTLGTFTVTIAEGAAAEGGEEEGGTEEENVPETLTIAEIVAMSDIPSAAPGIAWESKWKCSPDASFGACIDGNITANDINGQEYYLPLDLTATKNEDGKYVVEKDDTEWFYNDMTGYEQRYGLVCKWTFTIEDDVLISFDVEATEYGGYFNGYEEQTQHIERFNSFTVTKQA